MRKIETAEEKERKERKRQIVLSSILIFILIASIAGYATFSNTGDDETDKRSYNGLDFTYNNGFWETTIGSKSLAFYNLPYDLNDINISINKSITDYANSPVYLVGAYPSTIAYNLNGIVLRMQNACLENETCEGTDLPIKDCSDNLIIFLEGDDSQIYQQENCIFLEGDLQKTSDRLIYKLLGISI